MLVMEYGPCIRNLIKNSKKLTLGRSYERHIIIEARLEHDGRYLEIPSKLILCPRELKAALERRRATLRESLKVREKNTNLFNRIIL